MRALVLSGGGMFGAWQAGAWKVFEPHFSPDLIVGCSIGALNGYLIASGISPERMLTLWRDPRHADLSDLNPFLQQMTQEFALRLPLAVTITDLLRMKALIVRDQDVTWRHLAASIAVPLAFPQQKIQGHWYTDGGLLNPLPAWAAVELGATEILALHCLPEIPSTVLKPLVRAFRAVFGHSPPVPPNVRVRVVLPSEKLGGLRDALYWKEENVDRWIALGQRDAACFSPGFW